MARKILLKSNSLPYHITIKTNNSEFFQLEMEKCWDIFADKALYLNYIFGFQIHGLALMSNHYHMLTTTPHLNISEGLQYYHREVSKSVNNLQGKNNHLFGGKYHWKLIDTEEYYRNSIKYIYRKPVKAGICERVEEYPYSTLHGILGLSILKVPIYDIHGLCDFSDRSALEWLNTPFAKEEEEKLKIDLIGRYPVPKTSGRWKK